MSATIFLLSSMITRITQQILNNQLNDKSCQTIPDVFSMARFSYYTQNYVESYRLFHDLETRHRYKESTCVWYQIQCLIQLGHTQRAIAKCLSKMEKEPNVSSWYLVASDIYISQLDYTLAWEILHKATGVIPGKLNCFGENDTELQITKRIVYEGLKKGIQRRDIISLLPYDIACDVFKCLDLASLVKCTRVNKQWRQFLLSNNHLWNELEFIEKKAKLTTCFFNTCLARSVSLSKLVIRYQQIAHGDAILMSLVEHECNKLKSLALTNIICTPTLFFNVLEYIGSTNSLTKLQWGGISIRLNDLIDHLAMTCKNIKHLIVNDCFTALIDHTQVNSPEYRLEIFGDTFPFQFVNRIQGAPKLQHITKLELSAVHGLTASHLASILSRCPEIKKLVLTRCLVTIVPVLNILTFCCRKLQYFEYQRNDYCKQEDVSQYHYHESFVKSFCPVYKNIKKGYPWIEMNIRSVNNSLTGDILQNILYGSGQDLQSLNLWGSGLITDNGVTMTDPPLTKLKSLDLSSCISLTARGIEQIISKNPLLEQVNLSDLFVINDAILYALSNCTHLQTLNLSSSNLSLLSEEAVDHFIEKRKDTLKKVVLNKTILTMDLQLKLIKSIRRDVV